MLGHLRSYANALSPAYNAGSWMQTSSSLRSRWVNAVKPLTCRRAHTNPEPAGPVQLQPHQLAKKCRACGSLIRGCSWNSPAVHSVSVCRRCSSFAYCTGCGRGLWGLEGNGCAVASLRDRLLRRRSDAPESFNHTMHRPALELVELQTRAPQASGIPANASAILEIIKLVGSSPGH